MFGIFRLSICIIFVVFLNSLKAQQVITIGNGTAASRFPLGSMYKYECSASLLLKEAISCCGGITSVAWYPTRQMNSARRIKIYLKETDQTSLTSTYWNTMIPGASLLFDLPVTVSANTWNIFNLTSAYPFNGEKNLLVLVEASLGTTGIPDIYGGSLRSVTNAASKHEYWQSDTQIPVSPGVVESKRPNIQLTFIPQPMSISATNTLQNTDNLYPGAVNQPVIGIKITTLGLCSADMLTSMNFNTNGTVNTADILNPHLFYTGVDSVFNSSLLFGSGDGAVSGNFTISGSRTLKEGVNYFWLTYDISPAAQTDNCVDAECTSFRFGLNDYLPEITDPPGCRIIRGPMSGTYTIDPSGSGINNYPTFASAISDLHGRGFSDTVTFLVRSGAEFNESPLLFTSSGSAEKAVIFRKSGLGADPVINITGTSSANDAAVTISGCSHYSFSGLRINDAGTSSGNYIEYGFYIKNNGNTGSSSNLITDCTVDLSKSNTSSTGIYLFSNAAGQSGINSFNRFKGNTITDCYCAYRFTGSSIAGAMDTDNGISSSENRASIISNIGGGSTPVYAVSISYQKRFTLTDTDISSVSSSAAVYGVHCGSGTGNSLSLSSTMISSISGSDYVYGVYISAADSIDISGCSITSLTSSAKETAGIFINSNADITIARNRINGISISGSAVLGAHGIIAGGFGNALICNNMISNVKAPLSSGTSGSTGIFILSGSSLKIFYNSVLLNYKSNNASHKSYCLYISGAVPVSLRNNILINNTDIASGQVACAFFNAGNISSITSDTDCNIYYAGTPGSKNILSIQGGDSYQTLATYKTRLKPREQNSFTENTPFMSSVDEYDLHLKPGVATLAESKATPILSPYSITEDFDGQPRSSLSPDIGADEGDFTFLDNTPPVISFIPLPDTSNRAGRMVCNISITDNIAVAAQTLKPKIYWKKNSGGTWTGESALNSSTPYSFNISCSGLIPGDKIYYYFTAQDSSGNISANPAQGFSALNVNQVTSHPSNPASYSILPDVNYGGGGEGNDYYYFANSIADPLYAQSRPQYSWINPLTQNHTKISSLNWGNWDEGYKTVNIGFSFPYFGYLYTSCHISTNGYITFSTPRQTAPNGMIIPSTETPNNVIAPFTMDLNLSEVLNPECAVYYGGNQEEFVVTYFHAHVSTSPGYITFQVILSLNGNITFQYNDSESTLPLPDYLKSAACIGIENGFGSKGIQYRSNGSGGPVFGSPLALAFGKNPAGLPVVLNNFCAECRSRMVHLSWETKSEHNSYMFEIERRLVSDVLKNQENGWIKIGSVNASGNSNSPKSYCFYDRNLNSGDYLYRLHMVDNDGKSDFSEELNVNVPVPGKLELAYNYPNPFNSETIIEYSIPYEGLASLVIYDILGSKIKEYPLSLHKAGYYIIKINASWFSSGVYFYSLDYEGRRETKKFTIIK